MLKSEVQKVHDGFLDKKRQKTLNRAVDRVATCVKGVRGCQSWLK